MAILKSNIDTKSAKYRQNLKALKTKVQTLNAHIKQIHKGGSDKAQARHAAHGKLLVRERLALLLDKDRDFLELSPLAGWDLYEDKTPSGGIITGVGEISGRKCMIIANDATVKGGSYFPITVKKHLRAQEIAMNQRLPCIMLVDSAGAFLPMQDQVFPDKEHFGRIFYNQAQLSSRGIAQISLVMGSCTAGGAYIPAMSDESIMIKNQATIFLAGPPLVKASIGETVDAETLGGADVHCRLSGVADHYAKNDRHAIKIARDLISHLPRSSIFLYKEAKPKPPKLSEKELYGAIPDDFRQIIDVREIIGRLVDGSEFAEFKAQYGKTMVCGFAYIGGYLIGIIANNGILFSEAALKSTHFIELCSMRKVPLLFLHNVPGFMVGKKVEHDGIVKHGAQFVHAVSCSKVPKFTVIIGGSFGAGNYAMCGRAYDPNYLWMWPNARISVMGAEQAAIVLSKITQDKMQKQGKPLSNKEISGIKTRIQTQFEKQGSPYYSSARAWDDGVIDPMQTRNILIQALISTQYVPIQDTRFGVFRF